MYEWFYNLSVCKIQELLYVVDLKRTEIKLRYPAQYGTRHLQFFINHKTETWTDTLMSGQTDTDRYTD